MSTAPAPRRIEWTGPESWTVWVDEDGCHIRSARGDSLEMCDVESLFSLWTNARAMAEANHIPAPKPMTRDEARAANALRHEEYAKRRAIRAIEGAFDTNPTPF